MKKVSLCENSEVKLVNFTQSYRFIFGVSFIAHQGWHYLANVGSLKRDYNHVIWSLLKRYLCRSPLHAHHINVMTFAYYESFLYSKCAVSKQYYFHDLVVYKHIVHNGKYVRNLDLFNILLALFKGKPRITHIINTGKYTNKVKIISSNMYMVK